MRIAGMRKCERAAFRLRNVVLLLGIAFATGLCFISYYLETLYLHTAKTFFA